MWSMYTIKYHATAKHMYCCMPKTQQMYEQNQAQKNTAQKSDSNVIKQRNQIFTHMNGWRKGSISEENDMRTQSIGLADSGYETEALSIRTQSSKISLGNVWIFC